MTSQFSAENYEVYRSAGDFQWLHDVLQDSCPERVVAPLRTTISLDGELMCTRSNAAHVLHMHM